MTEIAVSRLSAPIEWTRTTVLRTLWAGCAVFVPLALIAVVAVEAVPHARGIAFVPQLRFALMTPASLISAVAAAFLYRFLKERSHRPGWTLTAFLFALALAVLTLIGILGPQGLLRAAVPVVITITIALSLLVPRFMERPRTRVGTVATVIFGVLEIVGVVMALASERVAPRGPDRMAFDIPRAMLDADHKFVDLPSGARIHYVDVGTGETLLFLHGNPAWSFQWRDLIGGLRGSFRCVAIDYPGFGLSSAPPGYGFTPREQSRVLEEFVDRLGLHDLTLVMQDWGGPIGLGLAGRRPELVRRVVVGNTWAWPTSTSEPRGIFSKVMGGPIGEFVQMNFNGFASLALKEGVVRQLPEDVTEMYLRPFRPLDRRGVAAFYPGQITAAKDYFAEVEAGLSRVADRRALILWGTRDPGFPQVDLQRFEKAFPNHRTIQLTGANHFFFEDTAQQCVEEIGAFVSGDATTFNDFSAAPRPRLRLQERRRRRCTT
ncbi:MAG TPA: alpha/beta fold hydrolase [Thermoanaerobaculia bacterium]|nr:alpha/beta fold hydrolase [Thermoanaerobaculia bacterium]